MTVGVPIITCLHRVPNTKVRVHVHRIHKADDTGASEEAISRLLHIGYTV